MGLSDLKIDALRSLLLSSRGSLHDNTPVSSRGPVANLRGRRESRCKIGTIFQECQALCGSVIKDNCELRIGRTHDVQSPAVSARVAAGFTVSL